MADFLARRVYEGKLDFADVPERFKAQVRQILHDKYGYDVPDDMPDFFSGL